MKIPKRGIRMGIGSIILLGGWRFFHYFIQDVPLGYDAGIYREYFSAFMKGYPQFDMSFLTERMQKVFPPFLGVWVSILKIMGVASFDALLTRGVALQSALVSIAMYFLISAKDKRVAVVVALLSWVSFVQYEVFWWNYSKQLLGTFFLLMTLGLWHRERRWLSSPLVLALAATHRPALLVLVGMTAIWCAIRIFETIQQRKKTGMRSQELLKPVQTLLIIGIVVLMFHYLLYPSFLTEQITNLFSRFIRSVDVPTLQDSYQSGGTFLTMSDLIKTNRYILLISGVGLLRSRKEPTWKWMRIGMLFLSCWIVFQLAFYQRMIGYADLFWLTFAGIALVKMRDSKHKVAGACVMLFFLYHMGSFARWVEKTRRPIMVAEELDFFQSLPELLPEDAIVMNTYNLYSPRLLGWGERPTISPGLWEIDVWNESMWYDNRRESDGPTKCMELKKAYGKKFENIYIWQGSKQWPNDFDGADCLSIWMQSNDENIPWIMYKRENDLFSESNNS